VFVLSGRDLCDELITRPEESYRLWCVVVCDLETSRMRRPGPSFGRSATKKNYNPVHVYVSSNILLILRRSNCINTASGNVTVSK
jgi:hypothetical protein